MSAYWTMARVARALGSQAAAPNDDRPLRTVCTDTRTLQPGDLFVALDGPQYDAHEFLGDAVARGAAAVIVRDAERARGLGVPAFVVPNTLHALGALGRAHRRAWSGPLVAVGGSNGKTSTKELLRAALGSRLAVHASAGNFNNQVGVPLTLLAIPQGTDAVVAELGTNVPGEIALLRNVAEPTVAVVTTVQEEHLEGFGSLEGVMREEASLLDGAEVAVVPAHEALLVEESRRRARRTVTAGLGGGDLTAAAHGLLPNGSGWLEVEGIRIPVPLRGEHNLRNAMLALAVAREFGIGMEESGAAIGAMDLASLPPMRSAVEVLGEAVLINDAYNANPSSVRAALALLAQVGAGRQRVAVLGSMRELGAHTHRLHLDVALDALRSGAAVVAGIGEFATALRQLAPDDDRVVTAEDVADLWPQLKARLASDAAILLKASRGVRLERLVPDLTAWAAEDVSPYRAQ